MVPTRYPRRFSSGIEDVGLGFTVHAATVVVYSQHHILSWSKFQTGSAVFSSKILFAVMITILPTPEIAS
jgi:hypothetical protein